MPRGKKKTTMTGADAQSIESVAGQRYGEGVEQQALQQAMPAPATNEGTGALSPSSGGGQPAAPTPPPPAQPVDPAAVTQYLGAHKPNLLGGTAVPDEPVTAGLSSGPGVGPQALSMGRSTTPLARYMTNLADQTGNEKWRRLAQRARL